MGLCQPFGGYVCVFGVAIAINGCCLNGNLIVSIGLAIVNLNESSEK